MAYIQFSNGDLQNLSSTAGISSLPSERISVFNKPKKIKAGFFNHVQNPKTASYTILNLSRCVLISNLNRKLSKLGIVGTWTIVSRYILPCRGLSIC